MGLGESYSKAIREHLNCIATWEPDEPIQVGDYGVTRNGVFEKLGHASSILHVSMDVRDQEMDAQREYRSDHTTVVPVKLGAAVGPMGQEWVKGALEVHFERDSGILLAAQTRRRYWLHNTQDVAREVLEFRRNGMWEDEWEIVREVVEVSSGTVIVCEKGNTKFRIEAQVPRLEELLLTNPQLNFSVEHGGARHYKTILKAGSTPLISTVKVHRRPLRRPIFRAGEDRARFFLTQADLASEIAASELPGLQPQMHERVFLLEQGSVV